jgi:hypothetical protein
MRVVIATPEQWQSIFQRLIPAERILQGTALFIASVNTLVVMDDELVVGKLRENNIHESEPLSKWKEELRTKQFEVIYPSKE